MVMRALSISMFFCAVLHTSSSIAETPSSTEEKELRYRDVYFHYYSRDYFTAITRMLAETDMKRLSQDKSDVDLLLGLLYSGYGLERDAENIFSRIDQSARNKQRLESARFYLARHFYDGGNTQRALRLLESIGDHLPEFLQPQAIYLRFFLYAKLGRFAEASDLLRKLKPHQYWYQYAAYNQATSLIKMGKDASGIAYLEEIGKAGFSDLELSALVDKANTALGFHFLKQEKPDLAIDRFQRVRLEGPYAHKAMLGMGWGFSQKKDYERALSPWLNLARGPVHETTVQEGVLASSFALQKLGAQQEALDNYENAIAIYQVLLEDIQVTTHKIRNGEITSIVFQGTDYSDAAITKRLEGVLKRNQGHLLGKVLQDKTFRRTFAQYRDLKDLEVRAQTWKQQLRPFTGMSANIRSGAKSANSGVQDSDRLWARLVAREKNLDQLLKDYESLIQKLLLKELDRHHLFVSNYLSQARYAVAQLLDEQVPR